MLVLGLLIVVLVEVLDVEKIVLLMLGRVIVKRWLLFVEFECLFGGDELLGSEF